MPSQAVKRTIAKNAIYVECAELNLASIGPTPLDVVMSQLNTDGLKALLVVIRTARVQGTMKRMF